MSMGTLTNSHRTSYIMADTYTHFACCMISPAPWMILVTNKCWYTNRYKEYQVLLFGTSKLLCTLWDMNKQVHTES